MSLSSKCWLDINLAGKVHWHQHHSACPASSVSFKQRSTLTREGLKTLTVT